MISKITGEKVDVVFAFVSRDILETISIR